MYTIPEPITTTSFKKKLPIFRPLTVDIINNSFQVNSYISDFAVDNSSISEIPQETSIKELSNTLYSKIQQNDQNINNNSFFENMISMIPSESSTDIFNKKDQIIKEIFNKIKKFYHQNNELIKKCQNQYFHFNNSISDTKPTNAFYTLSPERNPIEFPLPNDFDISENVQIATNGIELFLLADHFVFIFKLLIGTELLVNSYKRVDLDPNIKDYNQIICYGQDIIVTCSTRNFIIRRKVNNEWEIQNEMIEPFKNKILCSDGVVFIVLNIENLKTNASIPFKVYSLNDGSFIFEKSISFNGYGSNIPKVLMNTKFVLTNGTNLTMIASKENGKLVYLNFSLLNAYLISSVEEQNFEFPRTLCIHYDSVNNSKWILLEKKIDEITTVYSINRYPCFAPYNPFVCNDMKSCYEKISKNYFGFFNFKFLFKLTLKPFQNERNIIYGLALHHFKNEKFLFMFAFASLFLNPFISGMDQIVDPKLNYGTHRQMVIKFRLDDINIGKDETVDKEKIDEIERFHAYTNEILASFINCFYSDSFESCPLFALWILRQFQFSWYSKMHSQKMFQCYKSILNIKYNQDIRIPSLFLNILSINSISNAIIDIDDINTQEPESALFIYFLQLVAYSDEFNDNKIISNFLEVVFDLIPLISYRKRMVVTYFSFLRKFGFINLRSFFDYSLFISMTISCLLVSKNDLRWSYCSKDDMKQIENENAGEKEGNNSLSNTSSTESANDNKLSLNLNDNERSLIDSRLKRTGIKEKVDFSQSVIIKRTTMNLNDTSQSSTNNSKKQSINSNDKERSSINSSDINCENLLTYMPVIYGNWKPLVNKNINEKVKLFDAKCLFVFYKLIKGMPIDSILPNIKSEIKSNKELSMSLDLMYSYRNKYRKSMQERNEKWIEQTDILLKVMNHLKCDFGDNDKKALINEFMQHDYHIAYNFLYDEKNKKKLIEKGILELLEILQEIPKKFNQICYQNTFQTSSQLFTILFDLLTRFSKFNSIEMIKNEQKSFSTFQQIIQMILKIDNFQCINKFSALYIIRSLEACNDDELKKSILDQLLTVYDIEKGCYEIPDIYQNDEIVFIYDILILWLIPSINPDQLGFLKKDICEMNQFQWVLLNRIVDLKVSVDQSILNHLIESITNVDIFSHLGDNKTSALQILIKLNEGHLYTEKIDAFVKNILERIGDEIESFCELNDDLSISSYFLNEVKKDDVNSIFKKQFYDLVNFSDEFTREKILCCSLKIFSSMEKLTTDSTFYEKMKKFFSYAITHKQLSSGYLAMNAVNNFLSNQTFCDELINEIDIEQFISNLKSNNDQISIIRKIHRIYSLNEKTVDPLFDTITTSNGTYFISPIIKRLCIGSLVLQKEENAKIEVFICEDSKSSQLFNVVTHSELSLFNFQTEINIIIDTIQKNITIAKDNSIIFNNNMNPVRLVIFTDSKENSTKIKVENEDIFEKKDFIDRQTYGTFNIPKKKSFINKNKFKYQNKNTNFSEILQNGLNEKICVQFTYGKRKTLISIKEIVSISSFLKDKIIQSYKKYLTETTFFITAVKMVSFHPEILNYNSDFMLKIFNLLILNYDSFSMDLFMNGEFPFKIDNIILNNNYTSNYHFEDLSRYTIQKVLQSILNVPSFYSIFYYHMKNLYREYHSHFPRKSKIIEPDKQYNRMGFIYIPQFCENHKMTVFLNDDFGPHQLPYFSQKSNFSICKSQTQYLFYSINPEKRNWIFNSPFEFLILLKYFIFLSKTRKERELIKSCLFESVFINSPILSKYSVEFLKYIFLQSSFENDHLDDHHYSYLRSLIFYQGNSQNFDIFFQLFQRVEMMSKTDKFVNTFYQIFPEFSSNSIENDQIELKFDINDFYVYSNIEVNEVNDDQNKQLYSFELFNLTKFFKIKDKLNFPYYHFFKFWATAKKEQMEILREDITTIDLSKMRKQFMNDVNVFILQWTNEFNEEILNSMIEIDLNVPKIPFYIVSKTARKLTSLHSKFQMSLILTIVFILYEINRIFTFCDLNSVTKLIPDFVDFLVPNGAVQIIRSSIVMNSDAKDVPRLYIDRKSVYLNQSGCCSIIEQFSNEIKKCKMNLLQCPKPPFRVTFLNEDAIDASGPMRELMAEIANSIFQKKTNLVIHTPSDLSLYIPFTTNFEKTKRIYYAIGVYIGIVIRTNIPQSLPFAPLVWKYLANEIITEKDIVSVDSNLGQMFKNVRKSVEDKCEVHFPWKGTNWNSVEYTINGKVGKYVNKNEVEEFIQKVVNDRIEAILNPLIEMRNGLAENLGFRLNLPFGNVLSKIAQSESTFSVEDLMAISKYRGCSFESHSVSVFWAAVKRLTMDQLSLLLKFITTQTRIPIDSSSNFTIDIVEKGPSGNMKNDDMLLSASTCFNRLYLPCYSTPDIAYKKIIISIEYCQTMELS